MLVGLSRQSRNQTGGRRQNSSSAVRAILDDPPIHIRPVCSRKRGCEAQEPLWVQRFSAGPWLHSSATHKILRTCCHESARKRLRFFADRAAKKWPLRG